MPFEKLKKQKLARIDYNVHNKNGILGSFQLLWENDKTSIIFGKNKNKALDKRIYFDKGISNIKIYYNHKWILGIVFYDRNNE